MAKNQTQKQDAPAVDTTVLAPEAAPVADALASAGAAPAEPVVVADDLTVTARILVGCVIGSVSCNPDDVLEGIPVAVAESHRGEVDPHPDAVAHALSVGAPVKQYAAPEAAE